MRKSDAVIFHLKQIDRSLQGSDFGHHDVQFKIVDRVIARSTEFVTEENALMHLLHVLMQEVVAVQDETAF